MGLNSQEKREGVKCLLSNRSERILEGQGGIFNGIKEKQLMSKVLKEILQFLFHS